MRCPNPRCGQAIPAGSTSHTCGWGVQPVIDQRQLDHFEQQRVEARKAEALAFMAEHGLRSAEDCRRFAREKFAKFRAQQPTFERWCLVINEETIRWLLKGEGRERDRTLRRLIEAGVIDNEHRLIPIPERAAVAKRIKAERAAAAAELEARRQALVEQGLEHQEPAA